MSFSRTLPFVAVLLLASCARQQPAEFQRLAILRFENMTPDPATDWIGRALSEIITTELAGDRNLYAIPAARLRLLSQTMGARPIAAPGISAESQLALAVGATRLGYGEYAVSGGNLRVRLTIEDPRTRHLVEGPMEFTGSAADAVGAATALARRISGAAQPFGTTNPAAVEAYIRAIEGGDQATTRRYAEQAVAADPNFGLANVLLVETAIKQHDQAGAAAALEAASARASTFTEGARQRLNIDAASFHGDSAALERALEARAQSTPSDPMTWQALGDTAASLRRYPQAAAAYGRAATIEPEDANLWNQLGYLWAYSGNLDAAMNALRRYRTLRPADPNAIDSMGDVNVLLGRLKEAEELYLESLKKAPNFLNGVDRFKAAMARLMTGDVAGANSIMGDAGRNADWLWLMGRRREAYANLQAQAASPRRDAQLTIWALLLDDRAAAARHAAATPADGVVRFLAQPSATAADWSARATRLPEAVRESALAYALLLDRHFTEAIPALRRLEARSGSAGNRGPAIELAWALIETGKGQEAAPLLRLTPIPGADPAAAFTGLYFPRLFELRAIVANQAGKEDEARRNRNIYTALGGE